MCYAKLWYGAILINWPDKKNKKLWQQIIYYFWINKILKGCCRGWSKLEWWPKTKPSHGMFTMWRSYLISDDCFWVIMWMISVKKTLKTDILWAVQVKTESWSWSFPPAVTNPTGFPLLSAVWSNKHQHYLPQSNSFTQPAFENMLQLVCDSFQIPFLNSPEYISFFWCRRFIRNINPFKSKPKKIFRQRKTNKQHLIIMFKI